MLLLVEIPSIDTNRDYTVGQTLRIQKGRGLPPSETWHAEVVATHNVATKSVPDPGSTIGSLPPIASHGRAEYVRRIVVELRATSRSILERMHPGRADNVQVIDNYSGNYVDAEVLKSFDIKLLES